MKVSIYCLIYRSAAYFVFTRALLKSDYDTLVFFGQVQEKKKI